MPENATPSVEGRWAAAAFVIFLVAPLTVYLGAPPILNATLAQAECVQIAELRLDRPGSVVEARWTRLPLAQWTCVVDGQVVAHMGWMTSNSTDSTVTLLTQ
jgi:hypothetical protein